MGSRSHVLVFYLLRGAASRVSSRAFSVFISLCFLAVPVEAKREFKGHVVNCSQGGGGGGVLQVFARHASPEEAEEDDDLFLPKARSRWLWRSRQSRDTFLLPVWSASGQLLKGSGMLDIWDEDTAGEGASFDFCKVDGAGDMHGCKTVCKCPHFQQCYVHNEKQGGSLQDIGECSISMCLQVVISVLTIGLLVVLLLLSRMALIQHQVRQELLMRENAQRNGTYREVERRKYPALRREDGTIAKRPAVHMSPKRSAASASGKSVPKRGPTPEPKRSQSSSSAAPKRGHAPERQIRKTASEEPQSPG